MHFRMQILVTLCHEVLASDALDDYMENLFAQATQIRYLNSDFMMQCFNNIDDVGVTRVKILGAYCLES